MKKDTEVKATCNSCGKNVGCACNLVNGKCSSCR